MGPAPEDAQQQSCSHSPPQRAKMQTQSIIPHSVLLLQPVGLTLDVTACRTARTRDKLLVTRGDPVGRPELALWPVGLVQEGPGGDLPHKLASDNPQPTDLLKGLCCFVQTGQIVSHLDASHGGRAGGDSCALSSPDSTTELSFHTQSSSSCGQIRSSELTHLSSTHCHPQPALTHSPARREAPPATFKGESWGWVPR